LNSLSNAETSEVRRIVTTLTAPHACAVVRASSQSINNTTSTQINFLAGATVVVDTDGMFDTSSPAKLTVKHQGLYLLGAHVTWANNGTGRRDLYIDVNSSSIVADRRDTATGLGTAQSVSTMVSLDVGDVIEMTVYQDSGGALDATTVGGGPKLWVVRLT